MGLSPLACIFCLSATAVGAFGLGRTSNPEQAAIIRTGHFHRKALRRDLFGHALSVVAPRKTSHLHGPSGLYRTLPCRWPRVCGRAPPAPIWARAAKPQEGARCSVAGVGVGVGCSGCWRADAAGAVVGAFGELLDAAVAGMAIAGAFAPGGCAVAESRRSMVYERTGGPALALSPDLSPALGGPRNNSGTNNTTTMTTMAAPVSRSFR